MGPSEAVQQVENAEATSAAPRAGRNLVICLDGTNNQFGEVNTNVVRLAQVLDRTPGGQRLYYDPGVGTLAEPGAYGVVKKWVSKVAGLAFGAGLDWKAQEAYTYLMDFWEPGDQVYIFGFSRGAYTARVLAGMLYTIGLLPKGAYNLVPYAIRLYREVRDKRAKVSTEEWTKLCMAFRRTFSRQTYENDDSRHFPVHFLGVWDTVSSVGWVWNPESYPYTARNPGIQFVRHAVSINERRWFFRQNLLKKVEPAAGADGQDFDELWFAGVHCDVGGGYEPQIAKSFAELWREPFTWMLAEAKKAGLLIDGARLREVVGVELEGTRPWGDLAHESLTKLWWPAEFFPKQVWDSAKQIKRWDIGRGRNRTIPEGAWLDKSVLKRIREGSLNYMPANLSQNFIAYVKSLPNVPERLQYFSAGRQPITNPK